MSDKGYNNAISSFENGNDSVLNDMYLWFLPTSDFDDFVGFAGMDVANELYELIKKYKPDI